MPISPSGSYSGLTEQDFKKIIARRDCRYDGRFFFGVRTTKIYCRVTCPARPKPENILVFKSPTEAERSGFRPCLRCRPDSAPGSEILNGTENTVSRALRLIDDFEFESSGLEKLADKLGVTDRHLRRLFEEHLGASPIEIVITKRLHMAKRLILEANQPFGRIALAVGFQSIRRFNDAFKRSFDRTPSAFRKMACGDSKAPHELELTLAVHEPYDWRTVLAYLKRHEAFGLERVTAETYSRRYFGGTIDVSRPNSKGPLRVRLDRIDLREVRTVLNRLARLFDTRHNPAHLVEDGRLKPAGIRVPGAFDGFETAVSIILSQLVSTMRAKALMKKLIVRYGQAVDVEKEIYIFPTPQILRHAALEELGLPRLRATAIRELSQSVVDGEIDLSYSADVDAMRKRVLAIKGIGLWTTELIAMRCWVDPNAFPRSDLIVHRALEAGLCREDEWSSSRAYLTHCLWRDFPTRPLTAKQSLNAKQSQP